LVGWSIPYGARPSGTWQQNPHYNSWQATEIPGLLLNSPKLTHGILHPFSPPPDDRGDKTQADNQGNDVGSYDECIHIQVISHQISSLTAQDTTELGNYLACEDVLNNASQTGLKGYRTPAGKKLIQIRQSCSKYHPALPGDDDSGRATP
jgi:hypothetical protein